MKSNELRIGNWISHEGDFCQITMIQDGYVNFKYGGLLIQSFIEDIEPIPLTEEWFENFGAKRNDLEIDSYILSSLTCDYMFFKSTTIDGDIYWTCEKVLGDTCIKYVHQLQNLYFALTEKELIII